jgi:hypothetical protein
MEETGEEVNKDYDAREEIADLQKKVLELQDFAIWMTGCGYDFCQHSYFIDCRDKLLLDGGQSN